MRSWLLASALLLFVNSVSNAHGLLIPEDRQLPPLAMVNHRVQITLQDQVAVTRVEQTFRNHTDRQLEATYIFPVPKGASVNRFAMQINGKDVHGELVDAAKATRIYTEIIRRSKDPGLLEYMGQNNLFRLRVFPINPRTDQKVTLSYSNIVAGEGGLIEYVYPLKTNGRATSTLEDFSIQAVVKSQHAIQNIYSPTHAIAIQRPNDREALVRFEKNQGLLDKDFQLFYAIGGKDVGLTAMLHRPIKSEPGFFLFMASPRVSVSPGRMIARDMVFVLDTSGSMRGPKMDQARRALRYCIEHLAPGDRLGLISFATTVSRYRDELVEVSTDHQDQARKWIDQLEPTGGTAIHDALQAALGMRTSDSNRPFTIVFFTDGQPTIGETNVDKILNDFSRKNSAATRVFTFGVGDDVNAAMLDQLAEQSRAVSTYVRPSEDIEVKVSSLYGKISNPILANLRITTTNAVRLTEVYPPQLPDLFHGGQIIVFGRYTGEGPAAIKLQGSVGNEQSEYVYELSFAERTSDDKAFVEHLWARRKVGYLLDQIRVNGEKKELVEETVHLAKKYGIATPYTSYLIVPDGPVPVANAGNELPNVAFNLQVQNGSAATPLGLAGPGGQLRVSDYARRMQQKPGDLSRNRGYFEDSKFDRYSAQAKGANAQVLRKLAEEAKEKKQAYDGAQLALKLRDKSKVQTGKLGVDLAVQSNNLRGQCRLDFSAQRNVAGRNCLELGGVWIDEEFDSKMPSLTVKAMSSAYFRILERQPQMKQVFQLGNHLVWVAPNRTALIIDTTDGKETLTDAEIDRLFEVKKG